jgi:hypothetical protein
MMIEHNPAWAKIRALHTKRFAKREKPAPSRPALQGSPDRQYEHSKGKPDHD